MIGDDDTVLPLDAETGDQLYVWSSWTEPPPTLDGLLARFPEDTRDTLCAEWLCTEGEKPRMVGMPAGCLAPPAD